jgi:ligand-binding sensor domain-containing protein
MNIGRAKYSFDPTTEKFKYLLGYDNDHRNTDTLCGSVKEDANGKLWMNSWSDGFFIWNEKNQMFEKTQTPNESMTVFQFDKDEQGKPFMWCGGGAYGLMAYDTTEKKFFQFKNDPRDKYSHNLGQGTCIFRDTTSGIVWIGTENGLEKYDPHTIRFHRYRIWQQKDELTNSQYFFTSGFVKDKTDLTGNTWWVSVWIGGVYKWNRNKASDDEDIKQVPGIKEAGVFSMIQAQDGMIWVGHGLGVQILDPKTGKFIKQYVDFFPDIKKRRTVTNIIEDSKSNMWLITYQGLYSWQRQGDSIINWSKRIPALNGVYMPVVREDAEGFIWGTTEKGLVRIDPNKNEAVYFNNSKRKGKKLLDDYTGALHIDKSQHIWTSGAGFIAELDKNAEVIKVYDNKNGYIGTSVFNMEEDPQHFIWITTDNKLHRLDPRTGHFDYFDKGDGLFNNKLGDGFYINDQGELFLGFNGAMCSINTGHIAFNKSAPTVFPSRFTVKGQLRNFDENNKIEIKPGEKNIMIEFAALNYSQSTKNRFAFWLEGYDSTWRYTTDRILNLVLINYM